MKYFIGLISGTSVDGVDAALVEIGDEKDQFSLCESLTDPYSLSLRQKLLAVIKPEYKCSVHDFATLDMEIALAFSNAANTLITKSGIDRDNITAIGSHGQTIRHSTASNPPYSLQLGNGATIAAHTQIPVVNDFRSFDIASGGEGAPLVPGFHDWLFRHPSIDRAILNIGGIANLTLLPADKNKDILGFDTGPGNCLLDDWCLRHLDRPFDKNGEWAMSGEVNLELMQLLLDDHYFDRDIPKSTGREYFNLDWIFSRLALSGKTKCEPEDIQATLVEITVRSICSHLDRYGKSVKEILICGGGVENHYLVKRLKGSISDCQLESTKQFGVDPAMIEACAFAWLAYRRWHQRPTKLTTNQKNAPAILGNLHLV